MDYFSVFTQMLQAKDLADNTICSYKTYVKPYLGYLSAQAVSPEEASWQVMRDYFCAVQKRSAVLPFFPQGP